MKTLAEAVHEYLAIRRALGFKLRRETWCLPDFIAYLEASGSSVITTELAVRWARRPPGTTSRWWASRLSCVRQFARHHRASDPRTEIPPADAIPYSNHRTLPHLYTDAEVAVLTNAASRLPRPLMAASYTTIIGLLSATGMRVCEALALDDGDVDFDRELLTVRNSKFGKSRHIPLHPTAVQALRRYARTRDRLRPHDKSSAFFLSSPGTRVIHQNFHLVFMRLLDQAGLLRRGSRRPRIHDLRHTFAMATLRASRKPASGVASVKRAPQPRQPVRARERALLVPSARPIELADEREEAMDRGVDVRRELSDVVGQRVDRGRREQELGLHLSSLARRSSSPRAEPGAAIRFLDERFGARGPIGDDGACQRARRDARSPTRPRVRRTR